MSEEKVNKYKLGQFGRNLSLMFNRATMYDSNHPYVKQSIEVVYDSLIVDHPELGKGLIAGLGASGTSGRPGFGWFFSGDAYINSFSINSYGAHTDVRDILAFNQKWQRQDGKMSHELSQAEGYIDWWKKFDQSIYKINKINRLKVCKLVHIF